jgi:esterase
MSEQAHDSQQLEHLRLALGIAGLAVGEVSLPASRYVTIDNLKFHYLDWGTVGKTPILFLHGGGLSAHTWDLLCAVLKRDYHCFALDQRGHGESEWSAELDYDFETQKRDVEKFVEHLGFQRFFLVGMSMGGINALLYAAEHSARLVGLTIVDTGPDVRRAGGQRIAEFVRQTAEADSIDDLISQALKFNPTRDPRLLRRSLLHTFRRAENGKWIRKNDTRHWQRPDFAARIGRLKDYWEIVPRVSCPTLVVRGANSDVFHDEDASTLARRLPNGRWVRIENAGHTVQGDNPRGLLEALRQFFEEIHPA